MQKLNALVVDASTEFKNKARALLSAAGFEVDIAESGYQGLEYAQQTRYRLVCCCDDLPDIAGSEFVGS